MCNVNSAVDMYKEDALGAARCSNVPSGLRIGSDARISESASVLSACGESACSKYESDGMLGKVS